MEPTDLRNQVHQTSIAAYHWPKAMPRAVVHINHGLAEHAQRYDAFANALNQAGFAVVAHDHRGHGATTAPDAPQSVFDTHGDGVKKVLSDVACVHAHIRSTYDDCPLIMFGHSMGGLITMNYALQHPVDLAGAAVWNSNFSAGVAGKLAQGLLAIERMRLGSDVPSRLLPRLTFQTWAKQIDNARTPFDWLSTIEAEVDKYRQDPRCGWDASVSMWTDVFELIFSGGALTNAQAEAKKLPYHLLGGGRDPATNGARAVTAHAKRMRAAGFQSVEDIVFPDARHETLNDKDAEAATRHFVAWVNKIIEHPAALTG